MDGHSVTYPAVISEIMCFGSLQKLLAKLVDKPLSAMQRLMIAVDAAKVSALSLQSGRAASECYAADWNGFKAHCQRLCNIHTSFQN